MKILSPPITFIYRTCCLEKLALWARLGEGSRSVTAYAYPTAMLGGTYNPTLEMSKSSRMRWEGWYSARHIKAIRRYLTPLKHSLLAAYTCDNWPGMGLLLRWFRSKARPSWSQIGHFIFLEYYHGASFSFLFLVFLRLNLLTICRKDRGRYGLTFRVS